MMRDELRFRPRALRVVAQDFGGAAVQGLAATLEQAVVGGVADKGVLEAIGRPRRRALNDEEVGLDKPVKPGLQAAVVDRGYSGWCCGRHGKSPLHMVSGAGGQTGWLNPFAFTRAVRRFFSGPIVLAGGISDGCALRAARTLGSDLAYMGTRFIATRL